MDYAEALQRYNEALLRVHRAEEAVEASAVWGLVPANPGNPKLTRKRLASWETLYELDEARDGLNLAAAALEVARAATVAPRSVVKLRAVAYNTDRQQAGHVPSHRGTEHVRAVRGPRQPMTFNMSPEVAAALRETAERQGTTMVAVLERILREALPVSAPPASPAAQEGRP